MVSQKLVGGGEEDLPQLGDHSASPSELVLVDKSDSRSEVEWVVCVAVHDCGGCNHWDGMDEDCI